MLDCPRRTTGKGTDWSFLRDKEMQTQTGRAVQRLTSCPESETKLGHKKDQKRAKTEAVVLVLEAGVGHVSNVRRTIRRRICLSTLAHESSQLSTPCVKSIISYVSNHYSLFCHQFWPKDEKLLSYSDKIIAGGLGWGGGEGWKATLVEKCSPRWNAGRLSSD